jgi:hypothetical protein
MPQFLRTRPSTDKQDSLLDVLSELQSINSKLMDLTESVRVLQYNLQPTANKMQAVVDSLQEHVEALHRVTSRMLDDPVRSLPGPVVRSPRLGLVGGILYNLDVLLLRFVQRHAGVDM